MVIKIKGQRIAIVMLSLTDKKQTTISYMKITYIPYSKTISKNEHQSVNFLFSMPCNFKISYVLYGSIEKLW